MGSIRNHCLEKAVLLTVALITMAACASSNSDEPEQRAEILNAVQPTDDSEVNDTVGATPASSSDVANDVVDNAVTTPIAEDGPPLEPLPSVSDPCAAPVSLDAIATELTNDGYRTEFIVRDKPRPLNIRFSTADAATADNAMMVVMLHGAGGTNEWSEAMWRHSFLPELARQQPLILVMAQAERGTTGFWTQDATFNTDYLAALHTSLSRTFCLRQTPALLHGHGQGTVAAVQGYCAGSFPADALILFQGMVKLLECPAAPVPIISLDLYEFDPIVGNSWDSAWNPPVVEEVQITGGIQQTPDDLNYWSTLFGCQDQPSETDFATPSGSNGDSPTRPITVLEAQGCPEPIVAIGAPSADDWTEAYKLDRQVFEAVNSVMLDLLVAALE